LNEADYELHAELDTAAKQLKATETISYTNNSPDLLRSLWVRLEQNICKKDSRAKLMGIFRRRRGGETRNVENTSPDGFLLDSVEIEAGKQRKKPSTRLRHAYANSVGGTTEWGWRAIEDPDSRRLGRAHVLGRI
jgi:hypothetical protein